MIFLTGAPASGKTTLGRKLADLGTAMTEGERVLATGTTVTLTVPNKGVKGFYKVKVSPTAKKSE